MRISLNDGRTVSTWECDPGLLEAGKEHFLSIIIDGGPKVILLVVDGILNDGGDYRQFGWGRFSPTLQDVNGSKEWSIGNSLDGKIHEIRVYSRAITVSEAIGNYRSQTNH